MNSTPKTIMTTGAFDDIGAQDFRFLEESAKLGELMVLLWSDDFVKRSTGKPPKFPESERLYVIQANRYVKKIKVIGDLRFDSPPLSLREAKFLTWSFRESEIASAGEWEAKHGLNCRVIRDSELAGFPEIKSTAPSDSVRKKVIATGCFDWLHSGHVRFFEEVSGHGDLYVIVGHDANIRLLKGEGRPLFPQSQRRYLVGSIRYVTQALISTGHGWLDAEPEIKLLKPAIYAVNEDGDHPDKRQYCERHGIEYLVLKRTPAPGLPARSSTELRGTSPGNR